MHALAHIPSKQRLVNALTELSNQSVIQEPVMSYACPHCVWQQAKARLDVHHPSDAQAWLSDIDDDVCDHTHVMCISCSFFTKL